MPVGDNDREISLETRQLPEKLVATRPLWLENMNSFVDSDLLYRRRLQHGPRSADRAVWLRDDADDVESLADERTQRGRGEFRRAPKEHAHRSELLVPMVMCGNLARR